MVALCKRQLDYEGNDADRWQEDFIEATRDSESKWPYTHMIEFVGPCIQWLHWLGPFICGAFLLLSIVVESNKSGSVSPAASGIANTCCTSLERELKQLNRHIDEFLDRSGTQQCPGSQIPTGTDSWRLLLTVLMSIGVFFLVLGAVLLVYGPSRFFRALGVASLTAGAYLSAGGIVFFKDAKFSFKTDDLVRIVRNEIAAAPLGFQRVATIDGFRIGSSEQIEEGSGRTFAPNESPAIKQAAAMWIKNRTAGRTGVMLLIGSTDRLRLSGPLSGQYEANSGLAQARAESVRKAIIAAIQRMDPMLAPKADDFLVLGAGPTQTPASTGADAKGGYPQDRRVDVWAFWTASASSK